MKVLVVCQYYHPEPFAVTDVCEELVRRGHQVTVLTGLPNYPEGRVPAEYRRRKHRHELRNGVEIWRSWEVGRGAGPMRRLANYVSFPVSGSVRALRLADDFEVVLVYQLSPVTMAIPGLAYGRKNRRPVLIYCLDLWPASLSAGGVNSTSAFYRAVGALSGWIYRGAQRVLVTSESFRGYLISEHRAAPSAIHYLPQYAEDAPSAGAFAGDPPVPAVVADGRLNLVFCGNVGRLQSVDTIVRAAHILQSDDRFSFHIVGDGSALSDCRELAATLGVGNVIFHGRRPVDEMPTWYAFADALIVTMRDVPELALTLPRKVQSYMAAGRPIIAAVGGEAERVILDAGCGLCTTAEDPVLLAESCRRFAALDDRETMSCSALEYYRAHYDRHLYFGHMLRHLEQLVAETL